jgi:pimeloyl-ACP methyl ester carboxylesterase
MSESANTSLPVAHFAEIQERLLNYYGVNAQSRYVQLQEPALQAHVLEAGAGEPLVILHGGDGQAVDWAPLMAPLHQHFRLYSVDRPGFGLTDPFDYRRTDLREHAAHFVQSVLDALGLETATVLGGSLGGFFALAAALACPERVRRLVLVGMPVGISGQMSLFLRIIAGVPGASRLFMTLLGRPSMKNAKRQYRDVFRVDLSKVPDLYFEMRLAGLSIPGEQQTFATLMTRVCDLGGVRPEVNLADELPELQPPVLVIWGENETLLPLAVGQEACARIPRCQFKVLPQIGHFPFLEAPDRCAELIRRFLNAPEKQVLPAAPHG